MDIRTQDITMHIKLSIPTLAFLTFDWILLLTSLFEANMHNQACKRKAKNPQAQKDGVQKDDEIRMASMKCTPVSSIKMMYRILKIAYYLPETQSNGLKILNAK